jgi:hypothetical protein
MRGTAVRIRGNCLILPVGNAIGLSLFLRCVLIHCFRGFVAHNFCLSCYGLLTCGIPVSPKGILSCLFMEDVANPQVRSLILA